MGKFDQFYEAREIVTDVLQKDMIGPVKENEVLSESPLQYYIMGKLYPKGDTSQMLDTSRNPFLENETETYDASVSLSNQQKPASMAVTCTLSSGVSRIRVYGSYALYQPVSYEEGKKEDPELVRQESGKKEEVYWIRREFLYDQILSVIDKGTLTVSVGNSIDLQVFTNYVFDNGERVITVVLRNRNDYIEKDYVHNNSVTAFQPEICITGADSEMIFTSVDRKVHMTADHELQELEMLYRDYICFAQGHGCSVTWDDTPDGFVVRSVFMPVFDLLQMKPPVIPEVAEAFSMRWLYSADAHDIVTGLNKFVALYRNWIAENRKAVAGLPDEMQDAAERNMKKCDYACNTIQKTVDRLSADAEGSGLFFRAFRLANEAMFMQRCQSLLKEGIKADPDKITWYPFQLAFILQTIISFIDPSGEERKKADLLWFPTGGGKTEAYLGIAAFVMFLRRLKNASNDGVTVIMRYTLRLLTTQQFERASMLICACELLRQREKLGGEPFSIGLWVGGDYVPNHMQDAVRELNNSQNGAASEKGNPCQIKVCPWCGGAVEPADYHIEEANTRMLIVCPNKHAAENGCDCDFCSRSNPLPVYMIDDEIYAYTPTFLVATIDKFAQMPLSDKPASLFGISNNKKPPELIIQDELHLISGPLGTITGLYEAAISRLCEKDGVKAKIVASTATIRNAEHQIRALFGRNYTQFPPQGIDIKNSFFAEESVPDDKPSRRYLGVMGVDTTATTTLIRINAALLFASRYLDTLGYSKEVVDNFWTLTGYFNSLRELGGATTQILDDVQSRFAFLANTKLGKLYPGVDGSVKYTHNRELTSRMKNDELTNVIQKELKIAHPEFDAIDFLLASNMISVGVDVARLGVMAVSGQPKTNAEYIQSSSRVGRTNPGLVVTAYNPARSRDRSHYEQFRRYHEAMYRYVEATSVTPFSDRARERALHALFVTLCRYQIPGMLANDQAVRFRKDKPEVEEIVEYIKNYVRTVDPSEVDSVADELVEIMEEWDDRAHDSLCYKDTRGKKDLLQKDTAEDLFSTMNSMRSVESQSGIFLCRRS